MTIGVGLIGYGLGGRVFHAPFVRATPGLELCAVVSRDPAKVHADMLDMDVVRDVATLLARPGIDLVIVSSPDARHAEHALAAIAAGKHVVVDKPFATTLADARAVAAAAERAGVQLTVFHNRRWDADFLTLRRLIDDRKLGEIAQFESHFDRWRPQPAAVWKEARDGGSWLDLGPHLVDQALCVLGMPDAVTADIATLRYGALAPDWFHVTLHYSRCRAILQSTKLAADNALRFVVHGTDGSWIKHGIDTQEPEILAGASLDDSSFGDDPRPGRYTPGSDPDACETLPNERGDYAAFWRALAASLEGRGTNPVPPAEALQVMQILDAGLRSAAEHRTVAITE